MNRSEPFHEPPLVSVVTPFHNTAAYLAQCIESVIAQTYSRFEFILVDNCSNDGSLEIAEAYVHRDPRLRLIRRSTLLSQVQNYNSALAEISDASQYCKIVQADDFIFPDCLRLMVQAFEQSQSIGLVGAYDLKGNVVRGSGFPYPAPMLAGAEMARLYLRTGLFVFGSPTTLMYRSEVVRTCRPFYEEALLHEDTEKCMQILQRWDFGFVHQVLSFLRIDNANGSISAGFRSFQPDALDRYINVRRYAEVFLETAEAKSLRKEAKHKYYRVLAGETFQFRGAAFWRYHRGGLMTVGETLDRWYLLGQLGKELLRMAANPGQTTGRILRFCKRRMRRKSPVKANYSAQTL